MENSVARKGFENLLPQYRIDGFNPNDVLTMIEDFDENGQPAEFLYMEFAAAERWFYTVFPNGRMDYDVIALNDKKIVVKGKIFRDINDAMPAVTSLVSRYYTEDAHGKYFEQNAVTAAYRKALEYLGFGTPPDAVKTENTFVRNKEDIPERGEQGVMIPRPLLPQVDEAPTATVSLEKEAVKEEPAKETAKKESKRGGRKAAKAPVETPAEKTEAQNGPAQVPVQPPVQAPAQAPASAPAQAAEKAPEQPSDKMPTFEEALNFRVPYGSLAGKTIEEAAKIKGDNFIRYHCDRAQKGSDFHKATTIYCEYRGC